MVIKQKVFRELMKKGYSSEEGKKIWNLADMSLLYSTSEMAKGFLKLKDHPRYKATVIDIEIDLLKKHSAEFLKCVDGFNFNLIDMGCTEGLKAKALVESLCNDMKLRYCPVSVNEHFVNLALKNVKSAKFSHVLDYSPKITGDFNDMKDIGVTLRNSNYQKNVFLLLGSILGGFEINDYLFRLSQAMFSGDVLIIGNGIRKGERLVNLEVYKGDVFNNWFIHLIKALGFSEDEVEYNARFNNKRVEAFYRIKVDKEVEFERTKIQFKKGDEIVVAVLYKYFKNELKNFCKMYFSEVKLVYDSEEEYSLVFCKK